MSGNPEAWPVFTTIVHPCWYQPPSQTDSVQQTMNIICKKGSLGYMSSVVTHSIDKGVFYYFKDVTGRKIPFCAVLSRELWIFHCQPYGRLKECFIVTKEHTEDSKLPFYYGPRTLKLLNKASLFFCSCQL